MPGLDDVVKLSYFFQVPIEYLLYNDYNVIDQKMGAKIDNNKTAIVYIVLGIIIEEIALTLFILLNILIYK